MKKVTIIGKDYLVIHTYTGNDDEIKIDEDLEHFTVHFNSCSTSYKKKKCVIKIEYFEE